MKTVYEAANAIEAHMLQDLLRQEHIEADVQGAYLTGGIGELPAAGLVRLTVEDEDYTPAREIIERWEASEASPSALAPPRTPSRVPAALGGLLIGILLTYFFMRAPIKSEGADHNEDGILDERWKSSLSGRVLESEVDRNFDGKMDYVWHFDQRGGFLRSDADDDFDGRFESRLFFKSGQLEQVDIDSDRDTVPDIRSYYRHGVLRRVEYINVYTGSPLRVEHFKLNGIVYADVDTDKDGKLDKRQIYSPLQEVIREERLP